MELRIVLTEMVNFIDLLVVRYRRFDFLALNVSYFDFFNEFVYIEKTIKESFTHLHLYYNKHRHFNKQKTGKVKLTAVVCV